MGSAGVQKRSMMRIVFVEDREMEWRAWWTWGLLRVRRENVMASIEG